MKLISHLPLRRLLGATAFAGLICLAGVMPGVVLAEDFVWSPESLYNGTHPTSANPWSTDWATGPDGAKSIQVTITKGEGFYNYIAIPRTRLPEGVDLTAEITYRVVTPTVLPNTFYMFARNSKSQGYDLWQSWIGEPGQTRTISFPMQLTPIEGGTWTLYMGSHGPSSIIIDKLIVREGRQITLVEPKGDGPAEAKVPPAREPIATGFRGVTVEPPAAGQVTEIAAQGLVADGATPVDDGIAEANGKALQQLFKQAQQTAGPKRLAIPKGTYRFALKGGMALEKVQDLTIDGQGSQFIFQKLYTGQCFAVTACERVVWKNLSLDWNWSYKPLASLGKVQSVSDDGKTIVFEFPYLEAADVKLTSEEPWQGLYPIDPVTLSKTGTEGAKGATLPKGTTFVPDGNRITATLPQPVSLDVGKGYIIRHHYYEMAGFKTADCSNLTFDGITIYSLPGMGWINTGETHHWQFLNCRIVRPEGSHRPLSTAADGIHTGESHGDLIIRNCEFTGLGDDAINLHDGAWQGGLVRGDNPNQVKFMNYPKHRLRIKAGDVLRFYQPDYSPAGVELKVSEEPVYAGKPDAYSPTTVMTINFEQPVPKEISSQCIVTNTRFETQNVLIADCRFMNLLGRALLFAGRDATIENNTFRDVHSTPIQIQTDIVDNHWGEGHGSSNVVIRNNVFENTSRSGRWEDAVIYVGGRIPWGPTEHPLYERFLIEKNRFVNASGPVMGINFARNFLIRDNTVELVTPGPSPTPYAGNVSLNLTTDVTVAGNTWINRIRPLSPSGVTYNSQSHSGIESTGNRVENHFQP